MIDPMGNRRYKLAFVSNSAEIAKAVKKWSNPNIEKMAIHLSTMEEAVPVAKRLLEEGTEVILGGGGTGSLLIQKIGQPVIKIARTHLDILNALIKAKKYGPSIGLTSFTAPTYGTEVYERLLSVKIHHIVFNTTAELESGISAAIKQGVNCVVGGGICKKIANSRSTVGIVVLPSKEVILQSLQEARAVAASRRKERENTIQLQTILQTIKEGVIAIDDKGTVKIMNSAAADIFSMASKTVVGQPLPSKIKGTGLLNVLKSGESEIDHIRSVGKADIVINSLPIEVDGKICGAVATFKETSRIQAIDRKVREQLYQKGFAAKYTIDQIKSKNLKMKRLLEKAKLYAQTGETVMIHGETGSGKEFLAHGVHNLSPRRNNAFVAINCSALPDSLLESELFGYEEGAFTGAKRGGKIGLFELANGGTIFLDEISDISLNLQLRLLRVLEEREVMRIGGDRYVPIDVRILSSTLKNLGAEVQAGNFRKDLFFRLSVLKLNLIPLRERPEDFHHLVEEILHKHGGSTKKISPTSINQMKQYSWPGNIRELDSFIKIYSILLGKSKSDDRLAADLLEEFRGEHCVNSEPLCWFAYQESLDNLSKTLKQRVAAYEKAVIEGLLKNYNKKKTAEILGIGTNTLWRKLHFDG